jgi:hypothetical protein
MNAAKKSSKIFKNVPEERGPCPDGWILKDSKRILNFEF